jgi:hypothetical protein
MRELMDGYLFAKITRQTSKAHRRLVADDRIVEIHANHDVVGVPLDAPIVAFDGQLLVSYGRRLMLLGDEGDTIDYEDGTSDLLA